MDLTKFTLDTVTSGYNDLQRRKHALMMFSDLANDNRITPQCWEDLIKIGEDAYGTTFTDDSGYVQGSHRFNLLNKHGTELRKMLTKEIYYRGNWIIKSHVMDFVKENNMKVEFKPNGIPCSYDYIELD
jgi:hypothetical protein